MYMYTGLHAGGQESKSFIPSEHLLRIYSGSRQRSVCVIYDVCALVAHHVASLLGKSRHKFIPVWRDNKMIVIYISRWYSLCKKTEEDIYVFRAKRSKL